MIDVKKRIAEPNYTQMPNAVIDEMMSDMDKSELKVVLAICRKTFGWHKVRDRIAFSQLSKITGLNNSGVQRGIESAINRGIVLRYPKGNSFEYEIAVYQDDASTTVIPKSVPPRYQESEESVPPRYTQKKEIKETNKDISPAAKTQTEHQSVPAIQWDDLPSASTTPSADNPQRAMIGALADVCHVELQLVNGKYAKAAAKLVKAGFTAEQVRRLYGVDGDWYGHDWRGKQGQFPNIAAINETIKQAVGGEWKSNGSSKLDLIQSALSKPLVGGLFSGGD